MQQANQLGMVFARLDCAPRWRERLDELTLPTLFVHGRTDPFFRPRAGHGLNSCVTGPCHPPGAHHHGTPRIADHRVVTVEFAENGDPRVAAAVGLPDRCSMGARARRSPCLRDQYEWLGSEQR
jgi:hypothetical protein